MINTLRQTICDYSGSLAYMANNVMPFSNGNANKLFGKGSCVDRTRARILPQSVGVAGLFAPNTISWLRRSSALESIDSNNDCGKLNQPTVFDLTLLGVTNRPLPGYKKAGFNLFKTIVKITASGNVKNLDQCTIEFSVRFPISMKDFESEMSRQICIAGSRSNKNGRLAFYTHGLSNAALTSDLEALRLYVLKTMPVINIDWLNIDSDWDVMWNPCSNLKPVRKKLEAKLTKFLDEIIERVCASRCNLIINDSKSFFNMGYLPYRRRQDLPKLNIIISTLPASKSKAICEVLKPTMPDTPCLTDGWLPVFNR